MPDQKPPRVSAGERETLRAVAQYQRDSLVRKITGADEAAARRPPVGSGTTLLWLVKHMTRAEILWVAVRFAGQDVPLPGPPAADSGRRGGRRPEAPAAGSARGQSTPWLARSG